METEQYTGYDWTLALLQIHAAELSIAAELARQAEHARRRGLKLRAAWIEGEALRFRGN